jgi:hypothetical protein
MEADPNGNLENVRNTIPQLDAIEFNPSTRRALPRTDLNAERSYFNLAVANCFPKENRLRKETGRLCYPALSSGCS